MEREILFRGKRIDNGEWVEGYLFEGNQGTYILRKKFTSELDFQGLNVFRPILVASETVGQFTGKTTTNTSLVYYEVEKLFEDHIFTIGNDKTKYRVVLENYEWIGVSNEGDDFGKYKIRLSAIKNPIHIIGNIHDSPELLK